MPSAKRGGTSPAPGSLLAEIHAQNTAPVRRSMLDRVIDSLPDSDRADLLRALGDDTLSHAAIARALQNHGYPQMDEGKIAYWRRTKRGRD